MIYTYKCKACGHQWDEQRKVDERDLLVYCKACNGYDVMRMVERPAPAQFKGPGFYVNDYPKTKEVRKKVKP